MLMHNPPHPGEIIKEMHLKPMNLTITRLAKDLSVSRKAISDLVNGHASISPEMALRLAKAFHTTPELWVNLQTQYDLWIASQGIDLRSVVSYPVEEGVAQISEL